MARSGTAWRWAFACVGVCAGIGPAEAHGFAQRYDLPVPLSLYLTGAGAAVAVSFVVVALIPQRALGTRSYPRVNLLRSPIGRVLVHPVTLYAARIVSASLFLLVLFAGVFGVQDPFRNIAPVMIWVIWWVGFAYVSALVGNVWGLVNPWAVLFAWAEGLYRRLRPGRGLSLRLPYPERWDVWPAVVLFFAFVWIEQVWKGSEVPAALATAIAAYSALTWTGMLVFGREEWLRRGEVFWLVFGLIARFAPTEVRVRDPAVCRTCTTQACRRNAGDCVDCYACFRHADAERRALNLRPPAVGLLADAPVTPSMLAFVLVMLASVTFDGVKETPAWVAFQQWLVSTPFTRPLLTALQDFTGDAFKAVATLSLLAFPLLFFAVYRFFGWLMAAIAGGASAPPRAGEMTRAFALTLIPIALAYHIAHYLSFFLVAGQLVIPLSSDPFGWGWDLFGTTTYRLDIGIVGPRFVWFAAVAAVVLGHMAAVYLVHVTAAQVFPDRRRALRSQYPMLVLMVGYTMTSLWILAQPVVQFTPKG